MIGHTLKHERFVGNIQVDEIGKKKDRLEYIPQIIQEMGCRAFKKVNGEIKNKVQFKKKIIIVLKKIYISQGGFKKIIHIFWN